MNTTKQLVLPLLLVTTIACAKKVPEPDVAAAPAAAPTASGDASKKLTTEQAIAQVAANLERIHFEYDSDKLTADSLVALQDDAKILFDHRDIVVEIQGHTDSRGTTEYNLALGDRRAHAVVSYLLRAGVTDSQVRAVSFGKERPLDARQSEDAWAQNRRVEFRVATASSVAQVVGTVK